MKLLPSSTSPTPTDKTLFLSISPQSLASLSSALSPVLPPEVLLYRLQHFLPSVGIPHASDVTFARHLSLSETVAEFRQRRTEVAGPVLNSACPGWVCYAEKAHGEVLANLGRTRSAMGFMGALVKGWWARRNGIEPRDVYHVSVQPCPDRKLESSRNQFLIPPTTTASNTDNDEEDDPPVPETDLVLSTDEFAQLLQTLSFDPHTTALDPQDAGWLSEGFPQDVRHPGSSSDAYLYTVLGRIIEEYPPDSLVLTETPIRGSADYVEYTLTVGPPPPPPAPPSSSSPDVVGQGRTYLDLPAQGTTIFRSARCFGFKNLQNVVRKTKLASTVAKKSPTAAAGVAGKGYDYVEVMACPSGCVNGGGQLKPPTLAAEPGAIDQETRWSTKAHLALVESVYQHASPPSSDLAASGGPLKPFKGSAGRVNVDFARREQVDKLERTVREEMDAFWVKQAGGEAASWRRTDFQKIDSSESDGGLLGTGVVW